tara:strand:+ start:617 stop:826 length:210 start_codon:yes stop_codon:yes gene_type:complete
MESLKYLRALGTQIKNFYDKAYSPCGTPDSYQAVSKVGLNKFKITEVDKEELKWINFIKNETYISYLHE